MSDMIRARKQKMIRQTEGQGGRHHSRDGPGAPARQGRTLRYYAENRSDHNHPEHEHHGPRRQRNLCVCVRETMSPRDGEVNEHSAEQNRLAC
jgi:hypothetical protein